MRRPFLFACGLIGLIASAYWPHDWFWALTVMAASFNVALGIGKRDAE